MVDKTIGRLYNYCNSPTIAEANEGDTLNKNGFVKVNTNGFWSRTLASVLIFAMVFTAFGSISFAGGDINATLKASSSTVHSGSKLTLSVELSSAAAQDISAEISAGKKTITITVPAGSTVGTTEIKAGSYSKKTVQTFQLNENSHFSISEKGAAKVTVLSKPNMSFNADFLMAVVGKKFNIYCRCKNASERTLPLPISLRTRDGKVLENYTIDKTHSSFQYAVTIDKDWEFPYSLEIHNELTDSACSRIPVMVCDTKKPGIRKVDTSENKIALGFDCGYNNKFTDYILDTLDEYNAKATFFVTGYFCTKFPEQLKKIHERGHEIGNHTMNHKDLNKLSLSEAYQEIQGVNDLVYQTVGLNPVVMRPPHGACDSNAVAISRMAGCETVFWTMDSYDWDTTKSAETIISRSTKDMGKGCIMLFHNSAPKTKQTLKAILDDYKAKGLEIVSVSELLHKGHYTIDDKGLQMPDPDYSQISGADLMSGRSFSVNVALPSGENTVLRLNPVFDGSVVYKSKSDIDKIKADPSLMSVSYDCGETVNAPVKAGDKVATASFSYNNDVWFTAEMMASSDVGLTPDTDADSTDAVSDTDISVSPTDDTPVAKFQSDNRTLILLNGSILVIFIAVMTLILAVKKQKSKHKTQ